MTHTTETQGITIRFDHEPSADMRDGLAEQIMGRIEQLAAVHTLATDLDDLRETSKGRRTVVTLCERIGVDPTEVGEYGLDLGDVLNVMALETYVTQRNHGADGGITTQSVTIVTGTGGPHTEFVTYPNGVEVVCYWGTGIARASLYPRNGWLGESDNILRHRAFTAAEALADVVAEHITGETFTN